MDLIQRRLGRYSYHEKYDACTSGIDRLEVQRAIEHEFYLQNGF